MWFDIHMSIATGSFKAIKDGNDTRTGIIKELE